MRKAIRKLENEIGLNLDTAIVKMVECGISIIINEKSSEYLRKSLRKYSTSYRLSSTNRPFHGALTDKTLSEFEWRIRQGNESIPYQTKTF